MPVSGRVGKTTLASISNDGPAGESPAEYARAFARLENHYFTNGGFLETDGHILQNIEALRGVPGTIVQGRYDMICPPISAHRLSEAWDEARLALIPRAGHALSEPGISAQLVRTTNALRREFKPEEQAEWQQ